MELNERIQLLKKKIQAKNDKSKADIVGELHQLNKSFNDLKYLITGSEKVESVKQNEDLVELFKLMNDKLQALKERETEFCEAIEKIKPSVIMPSKFSIANINEAKPEKELRELIESFKELRTQREKPRERQTVKVEGLDKSLEKILPKEKELPETATMEVVNNLWKSVSINYPKGTLKIQIDRNDYDVIRKLTFIKE